jgi:hypothetical protein
VRCATNPQGSLDLGYHEIISRDANLTAIKSSVADVRCAMCNENKTSIPSYVR